ncbi:DNA repair protein RecN [Dissulfurirhabdus thermomarina]|uniref:DNA repair protein RecN n=2 Tax=Dissulfurirhabdus thermomarina TaxID=1765737 RepID=A0A6N9TQK5_DISTH|nr:DNA repair protein RecN [Dissulfurirhabdus thermomarina]
MLAELLLENFVLIDRAALAFPPGFTVLTGETGAGKSLMVRAVQLILGDRGGADVVRTGAEQGSIQAVLEPGEGARAFLEERGIEAGEDDGLILRRVFSRGGRGRIYVNGVLVTLQDLRALTGGLVSLAGQHDYQHLLRRESHGPWLDRFGGLEDRAAREEALERLRAEAGEIDALAPQPGEDEALEAERRVLRHAATLREIGERCHGALYAEKGAVCEVLARCRQDLERMAALDERLARTLEDLQSAAFQAEEAAFALRDYLQDLPADLSRLEEVEERLHRLERLKRTYGPELADVLEYRRGIDARLADLERGGGDEERLAAELARFEAELLDAARELSEARKAASGDLARAVMEELSGLKLDRAWFEVGVQAPAEPTPADVGPEGLDRVEFLFCPNVGEPIRPLAAIASGGELSRVTLALRAALARRGGIETVIFDEIDAGLGGEVADRVGQKLKALSAAGQVIAITHFPQIAAMADHHLVVEKSVEGDRTVTRVRRVEGEERVAEIARMLGGEPEAALAYARGLVGRPG